MCHGLSKHHTSSNVWANNNNIYGVASGKEQTVYAPPNCSVHSWHHMPWWAILFSLCSDDPSQTIAVEPAGLSIAHNPNASTGWRSKKCKGNSGSWGRAWLTNSSPLLHLLCLHLHRECPHRRQNTPPLAPQCPGWATSHQNAQCYSTTITTVNLPYCL